MRVAAVAIFQAGNTRKVYKGSQIMIHEPSCYIYGRYDVQGIKKVEKQLEAGKKSLVAAYEERTGREKTDLEKDDNRRQLDDRTGSNR